MKDLNYDINEASNMYRGILLERIRQIREEGHFPEHDDRHVYGELGTAAACYALDPNTLIRQRAYNQNVPPKFWPFDAEAWKPALKWQRNDAKLRLRELEKAGALILAEMERWHRLLREEEE